MYLIAFMVKEHLCLELSRKETEILRQRGNVPFMVLSGHSGPWIFIMDNHFPTVPFNS